MLASRMWFKRGDVPNRPTQTNASPPHLRKGDADSVLEGLKGDESRKRGKKSDEDASHGVAGSRLKRRPRGRVTACLVADAGNDGQRDLAYEPWGSKQADSPKRP